MGIGHFAVGFAAKKFAPKAPLALLLSSALLLDLIWVTFLAIGFERVDISPDNSVFMPFKFEYYPYSHGLLSAVIWALIFSLVFQWKRAYLTGSLVVFAGVLSHWVLDSVVHSKDLPIYPGSSAYVGFSLWNHHALSMVVEGILMLVGVLLYLNVTRPINLAGITGLWAFVLFISALYFGKLAGLPIENHLALVIYGLAIWLTIPWAWWIERHRSVTS